MKKHVYMYIYICAKCDASVLYLFTHLHSPEMWKKHTCDLSATKYHHRRDEATMNLQVTRERHVGIAWFEEGFHHHFQDGRQKADDTWLHWTILNLRWENHGCNDVHNIYLTYTCIASLFLCKKMFQTHRTTRNGTSIPFLIVFFEETHLIKQNKRHRSQPMG